MSFSIPLGEEASAAKKLTDKQKRFIQEYLVDLNATQAAIRAGYSKKTAEVIGYENLRKPQIAAEVEKQQAVLRDKLSITQEMVIEELAAIAFANGSDFVRVTTGGAVRVIPTEEVPKAKRRAISTIKAGAYGPEVKTHDKVRALELLGRHLGVFDTGNGADPNQENNLFDAIAQSTRKELDTHGIPELEHPTEPGNDLVGPS